MNTEFQMFGKREKEVISLLVQGKSNKQIAYALGISVRTVEYHLGKVYAKLNVASRTEAIIILSKSDLWTSTVARDHAQGESLVENVVKDGDHDSKIFSIWRISMKNFSRSRLFNRFWVTVTIGLSIIVIIIGFPIFQMKFGFPKSLLWTFIVVVLVWLTYIIRAYLFASDENDIQKK